MPQEGYKSITISEALYQTLQDTKLEILKRGINSIPEETKEILESTVCPICGTQMNGVEMKFSYYKCPKCNFQKPQIDLKLVGSFALGAIATIAVIVGLKYLFSSK